MTQPKKRVWLKKVKSKLEFLGRWIKYSDIFCVDSILKSDKNVQVLSLYKIKNLAYISKLKLTISIPKKKNS